MTILVTGGAGYIGSHLVKALLEKNYPVLTIDNLTTGQKKAVLGGEFLQGDILDKNFLSAVFKQYAIQSVIHLAAKTIVPESIERPLDYYETNIVGSMNLLKACQQHEVSQFIFSSSAAVYGNPINSTVTELSPCSPAHPYGFTKYVGEQLIQDVAKTYPLTFGLLRYFNVAGASPDGLLGQSTPHATLLIKVAAEVATGKKASMPVYGTDYDTPDGTAIRDFIHVCDLVDAHILLLEHLRQHKTSQIFNCGYGKGYSVQEVINTMHAVSGKDFAVAYLPRRQGDCAKLIADPSKIIQTLNWQPKYTRLEHMVESAYLWEKKLNKS
jgi:UDP-glucose 4-epimerase